MKRNTNGASKSDTYIARFDLDPYWWLYYRAEPPNLWDLLQKVENKKTILAKKVRIEIYFFRREFEAEIRASCAASAAALTTTPSRLPLREDDNILDEIPLEIQSFSLCFADLPLEEIINIFHKNSKLVNLYQI